MKRFSFRLQSLLNYRSHLEYFAKQETAKAYMDVRESEERIAQLRNEFSRIAGIVDNSAVKGVSAREFKQFNDYLDSVDNDIKGETARKKSLMKILRDKQKILTEKSVELKVLERLKEKQEKQYMDEFFKDEQKNLDEVASLKKAREITNAAW